MYDNNTTRRCTMCGTTFPATLDYFHKHGTGLHSRCKVCSRERKKQYYQKNREDIAKRVHEKYLRNKQPQKERSRRWYEKNRQLTIDRMTQWRKENPEKVYQQMMRSVERQKAAGYPYWEANYRRNKQQKLAYGNAWRQRNIERVRFLERQRAKSRSFLEKKRANNNARRARELGAEGSHTLQEWQALKECYNFRCLCCGKQEPEIHLTRDHVVPLVHGGTDYIDNIQPLCRNCNCIKHARTIDYRVSS